MAQYVSTYNKNMNELLGKILGKHESLVRNFFAILVNVHF